MHQAGDQAGGDTFGVHCVCEIGLAGGDRPCQAQARQHGQACLFCSQAGGDQSCLCAGNIRAAGQQKHRIAFRLHHVQHRQFCGGLNFRCRITAQQDFKTAGGFAGKLTAQGDIGFGPCQRAAGRAHIKRLGETALEAPLCQDAHTVACFIGLQGDIFLREGGVQIDPGNRGLRSNRQFGGCEISFACSKIGFGGGNAAAQPVPQIRFPAGIDA